MKTKSLFIAVLALLAFAGNVIAQRDITSQYITNATLANGTTGWTVSNFNAPQRGNNTVGYATEAYAGWGNLDITSYSLTQTITLPKGSYRLAGYSFFRQGVRYNTDASKSLAYLKAGNKQVAIKTLGSISGIPTNGDNGGYANSQAEGANCFDSKMYRNVVEFEIVSDNTPIEIGIVGTFDLKQSWVIVGMFELFDLNDVASVSSPTDVTYAVTNSGFEYRNTTGWTVDGLDYEDNDWSNKTGIGFVEKWQWDAGLPNARISQKLTGLENGLYELSVYGHNVNQRNGDAASKGMFLTANDAQTEIGAYGQYKVRTTVTDGTLTIGVTLDNCTGNWIAFDSFGLQFYGDPDQAMREFNRAEMLAALERFENEYNLADGTDYGHVTMSAAAWTDLLAKVNAVSLALDDATQASNYGTLKDELTAQLDATDASLRLFKSYKSMADGTVSVLGGSAAEIAPSSDTDTDAAETDAITRLNNDFITYAMSQNAAFDVAAYLGDNLDFSAAQGRVLDSANSNAIYDVSGWDVGYADADTWAVLQNQHDEHQSQLFMRKNWGSAATTLTVAKQRMLPVGKYTLAFSWNSNLANLTNLSAYAIDGVATSIGQATSTANTLTYDFEITDTPKAFDLVFGFKKQGTGNTPAQIIVDDVTLTYHPDALSTGIERHESLVPEAAPSGMLGAFPAKTYDLMGRPVVKPTNKGVYISGGKKVVR